MRPVDILPHAFFVWCQHSALGLWIDQTAHVFTIIETIHIMSYTILLGTTVMVDMRLLGLGKWRSSTTELAHELEPWMLVTLVTAMFTGIGMFFSEAQRLSISTPFLCKIALFTLAVLIHFTIHWRASMRGIADGARFGKFAAWLSLICWFGVALAGRSIAFL